MNAPVLAVVGDLFFATKIAATAEAAGVALETIDVAGATARLTSAPDADPRESPRLVIVDLALGGPALALVRAVRATSGGRHLAIVGFHSHVDTATRDAARAAGVDPVLPRSAFVARLPALLAGGPGPAPLS